MNIIKFRCVHGSVNLTLTHFLGANQHRWFALRGNDDRTETELEKHFPMEITTPQIKFQNLASGKQLS